MKRKYRHNIFKRMFRAIRGGYRNGGVVGVYHWLRCHIWNRYHIINISKAASDYSWGWIDKDNAIFLACFKLLKDFVELEEPFKHIDWSDADSGDDVGKEIFNLYKWWVEGRPEEYSNASTLLKKNKYKEWSETSKTLEDKDDEMLSRLMKIRKYLWT